MRVFRISISSLSSFCLVSLLCRFNCVCGASSLTWNWFPAGVQFKSFNCSSVPHRCTRDSYVSRSRSRSCCSCLGGLNAFAVRVVPQQSKSFNWCALWCTELGFFRLILQVPAVARQLARVACAPSLRTLDGRWVTNEETLPLIYWGLEAKGWGGASGSCKYCPQKHGQRKETYNTILKPQEQQPKQLKIKIKIKSNPTRNKAMSMLNIFRYSACLKRPLYYSGKCLKHINQTQTEKNPSETQPS